MWQPPVWHIAVISRQLGNQGTSQYVTRGSRRPAAAVDPGRRLLDQADQQAAIRPGWLQVLTSRVMAAPDGGDPDEPLASLSHRGLLIPAADVQFVRLPKRSPEMQWFAACSWEDIPDSPCTSIDPAEHEFVAIQDTLRLDVIHYYANNPDRTFHNSDLDIAVELLRLTSGQLFIMEGHHRIAGALVAGRQLDAYIGDLTVQHMQMGHAGR